jgi:putative copper export protein
MYAVAVVLLTGGFKGWSGLDHQSHGLVRTGWGRILLGKLMLVAVALALGWLHRRWIRMWTPEQRKTLGRTLRVEAVVLTLVIAVSAWLASVDPAGS